MKTFTKAVALLMSILVPASDASAQCFVLSLQHRLETKQVKYFFMDDWPEPIADPPNAQPTTVKGCIVKGFMLWHGSKGHHDSSGFERWCFERDRLQSR